MADTTNDAVPVDFRTEPARYRHWKLSLDGPVATLAMDVREDAGLRPGYELKLNSYDLGVDIELYDAVQRLRFEHPEVGAVIVTSGKERVFCAGANIRMLGQSSHGWKVNFCKFTNETRNAIEEASAESRQTYLCMVNGPCAGAGLSLACACDLRIAADTATFVPGFIGIGLVPDSGGSWFVHRLLGFARAFEWMTSNRKLTAAEAHAWGLVSEVTDDLPARAAALAAEYAALPTRGIGLTKRLFEHAYTASLDEQLELEAALQQEATGTADFAEGVAAFLEKRPPRFTGA